MMMRITIAYLAFTTDTSLGTLSRNNRRNEHLFYYHYLYTLLPHFLLFPTRPPSCFSDKRIGKIIIYFGLVELCTRASE